MRELQRGLWHRQAPHPDWTSSEPWRQEVSSYAIDDGARLLLFDPLAVPSEILELAAERKPVGALPASRSSKGLRSLLALRVEAVLPAHGAPTDRAALERALS